MCGMDEEDIDLLCAEMALGFVGPDLMVFDPRAREDRLMAELELGPRFGVDSLSFVHHWNGAVCRTMCWRNRENITGMVEAWHGGPLT